MVVFDTTTLLLLLNPDAGVPTDSEGKTITYAKERIDGLVETLAKANTKIIIPTPALAEALVQLGQATGQQILARMRASKWFRIEPFDEKAAVELAMMTRDAKHGGNKKGSSTDPWQKVKFDRQIVAIAKVNSATVIYSDDAGLAAVARDAKIKTMSVADLDIPAAAAQTDWVKAAYEQAAKGASNLGE